MSPNSVAVIRRLDNVEPGRDSDEPPPWAGEHKSNGNGRHGERTPDRADLYLDTLRSRLLTPQQLDELPPPEPLIDGLLVRDTIAAIYGKPGSGKSFAAMDVALSVASGTWWLGRKVHSGPVIYVAAEGAAGLPQRKRAWEKARNVIVRDGIHWLPCAVNLLDSEWSEALVRLIAEHKPVLVVIDTVARSMVGGDENAAKDMGRLVENADRIRRASGATVLLIHHSPKSGGDLRGHSSLEGAVDTAIEVVAEGDSVTIKVTKQKDMAKADPIKLKLVPTGESAVLSHDTVGIGDDLAQSEAQVLEAILGTCGREGLSSSKINEIDGLPSSSHYRAMNVLVSRGLIVNVGTEKMPRWTSTNTYRTGQSQ